MDRYIRVRIGSETVIEVLQLFDSFSKEKVLVTKKRKKKKGGGERIDRLTCYFQRNLNHLYTYIHIYVSFSVSGQIVDQAREKRAGISLLSRRRGE